MAAKVWHVYCGLYDDPRCKKPWLSLNDRDRTWHRRNRLSEWYRTSAYVKARELDVPQFQHVYMTYVVSFGDRRKRDTHNYMATAKPCIDGIVDAGVIPDDNNEFLLGPLPVRDETFPRGITLTIQERGPL